ncbi:NACHT domain-containing protein [Phormidesmis sp. 146-33]
MVFDPVSILTTEALKKLTTLVIDAAWKQSGRAIDRQTEQQIGNAMKEYVATYEKRHCSLKYDCLRMDNSLRLEEIYTDVQVLDTRESRRFESPEGLKDLYLEIGRGFVFEQTTRKEGIAVANLEPRLMMLGSPGIGKSTFLRKVGLEALKWETGRFRHELLPVFVELKRFDATQTHIEKFIAEEFETCGFPNAEVFTQNLLKAGKLLILLDGLDEVPTDQVDRAIEQIGRLVDRYDKNHFIASCRIAAYKGGFPRFKDVTMANFSDSQMETFVCQWFRREPKIADQCWELLSSEDYKATKELGQTPLLLTLLCAVYNESQSLPKQRASLYGEALDVWLKKWASEKRIQHNPIYQELSLELERILLSEIAYQSFAEDQLFLSKRELTDQIREFLMSNLNASKTLDAEKVLNAIEVQQGILVERARDAYSFSHLTFQEYLTAQYIVDERQVETLVAEHLTDERWREVFFLVAGLSRNADDLLAAMKRETQKLINSDKLKALIDWSEQTTKNSVGDYKPAAKRFVAIFVALLVLVRDRALVRDRDLNINLDIDIDIDIDLALALARTLNRTLNRVRVRTFDRDLDPDLDLDLALALDLDLALALVRAQIFNSVDFSALSQQLEAMKAQVPGNDELVEVRRAFANRIRQTWYEALHLDPEWLDLSEEEERSLENYLYANELMVRCKEAALRVSPQVWDGIESRMLTIPDNKINS